ncbi:hypothetical protein GCM10023143_22250 [Compostibacter hankyongensis]|uniref:beta-N-acetylhexosaminidase n=2 Tax=Compostibacter hankyongensis TaxID=1007089 RepID=A0ABP8FWP4_9BACT
MSAGLLGKLTGYPLQIKTGTSASRGIVFQLNKSPEKVLGTEGYRLDVSADKILITANQPVGLFYGLQTLLQLLPASQDAVAAGTAQTAPWTVPGVSIMDYPRFGWRGLMLDVSRHFFSKEFVKKYIDEMARYKYNVFHWHLTDDNGWRIEIPGLPRLTQVGAWRVPRTGRWGSFTWAAPGEKASDGGYYTTQDIKDIVEYARSRFVTIVPEIDVPAHSLALIAAYPNLSCTGLPYQVPPQYAEPGVDNVLCVANDSTWLMLDKIFTQVAALFPGKYIHVGGDEANRSFWMKDPRDQALMKKEGITAAAGLQSFFESRLEKLIHAKGKSMLGWDEILEGGLPPDATVMSWRGIAGGIEAAKQGHHVVMTPTGFCYLDYLQGDPAGEPAGGGQLLLSTCYQFNPVPEGVDSSYILGGQGNLWAENVPNPRHAEYMTWPRALALSEVFWSPARKRNWVDFTQRMTAQFAYLDRDQVKYATSAFNPRIYSVSGSTDSVQVALSTEVPGLKLYYSFDGTNPDPFYPEYTGNPIHIPQGASEIRVVSYAHGKQVGRQVNLPLADLKPKP